MTEQQQETTNISAEEEQNTTHVQEQDAAGQISEEQAPSADATEATEITDGTETEDAPTEQPAKPRKKRGRYRRRKRTAEEKKERHNKDRRVVRTRNNIRNAFGRLLEEKDYRNVTISAIAEEADVDRKTFYIHYDNVENLVDEILEHEAETLVRNFIDVLDETTGEVDVEHFFNKMRDSQTDSGSECSRSVLLNLPISLIVSKMDPIIVSEFKNSNIFGLPVDSPYLPFIVTFFYSGLITSYRRWVKNPGEIELSELSKLTQTCLFEGIHGITKQEQRNY